MGGLVRGLNPPPHTNFLDGPIALKLALHGFWRSVNSKNILKRTLGVKWGPSWGVIDPPKF